MSITIFEKILSEELPTKFIYEDKYAVAFHDVNPQAPVHILIIPKRKIINIASIDENDINIIGHLLWAAKKVAVEQNIHSSGYRLIFNNNKDGGQTVDYLHCHLLGGRCLKWPPG